MVSEVNSYIDYSSYHTIATMLPTKYDTPDLSNKWLDEIQKIDIEDSAARSGVITDYQAQ